MSNAAGMQQEERTVRPSGVTLIACWHLLSAAIGAFIAAWTGVTWYELAASGAHLSTSQLLVFSAFLVIGIGQFIVNAPVGIGLLKLRRWSRTGAQFLAAVGIGLWLARGLRSAEALLSVKTLASYGLVALNTVIFFYLRRPAVKQAFGLLNDSSAGKTQTLSQR